MTRALGLLTALLLLALPATAAARTLVGTPGKDRLVGGNGGNVINGDGGGDVIIGGGGTHPPPGGGGGGGPLRPRGGRHPPGSPRGRQTRRAAGETPNPPRPRAR